MAPQSFDQSKCELLGTELLQSFQKYQPTIREILIVLSNLIYAIGASIEGYQDKGPSMDDLQKDYYANPGKVGVALMLQGLTMSLWPTNLSSSSVQVPDNTHKTVQE